MPRRYDVAAYFSAPVNGRDRAHTREPKEPGVYAETPEAAARMWLWRLSEVEREATVRLVVFAPVPKPAGENYAGPPVRYLREGGKLVEITEP
jgi:hypothetical protein